MADVRKRDLGYVERAQRSGKKLHLYRITRSGSNHTRREPVNVGGKIKMSIVTYGVGPGKKPEILLTEEGAKALRHMDLIRVIGGVPVDNPVEEAIAAAEAEHEAATKEAVDEGEEAPKKKKGKK